MTLYHAISSSSENRTRDFNSSVYTFAKSIARPNEEASSSESSCCHCYTVSSSDSIIGIIPIGYNVHRLPSIHNNAQQSTIWASTATTNHDAYALDEYENEDYLECGRYDSSKWTKQYNTTISNVDGNSYYNA